MAARSAQLGVLVVVAFLSCAVSTADNDAGAMVADIPTRHLLQTVQQCPVDFATHNYSVVTNVCNASNPDIPVCCAAFVELACPYAAYLNDPNTNCDVTMFSYLNMAGNYPEQMFQACQGNDEGLPCPLVPEPSPNPSSAIRELMPSWRFPSLVIFVVTLAHLVRCS